jgi:DNA-binding HxlR family transcriptional regulator
MKKEIDLFGKCPYFTAQKVFSGKWSVLILFHLNDGPLRYGELQRRLGNLSQATLTKQLRQLEDFKIIDRQVYSEIPPKVEYSLSALGQEFAPVLEQFEIWGDKYINALEGN